MGIAKGANERPNERPQILLLLTCQIPAPHPDVSTGEFALYPDGPFDRSFQLSVHVICKAQQEVAG